MRINTTVSAHILILDQPLTKENGTSIQILLTRLAYKDHRAGKWSFPGGFVDQGEDLDTALKREIAEEIGVTLKQYQHIETVPVLLTEHPNIGFIFLCDQWSGLPTAISREIMETAWINEARFLELIQTNQLAYPQMQMQTRSLGWQPPNNKAMK